MSTNTPIQLKDIKLTVRQAVSIIAGGLYILFAPMKNEKDTIEHLISPSPGSKNRPSPQEVTSRILIVYSLCISFCIGIIHHIVWKKQEESSPSKEEDEIGSAEEVLITMINSTAALLKYIFRTKEEQVLVGIAMIYKDTLVMSEVITKEQADDINVMDYVTKALNEDVHAAPMLAFANVEQNDAIPLRLFSSSQLLLTLHFHVINLVASAVREMVKNEQMSIDQIINLCSIPTGVLAGASKPTHIYIGYVVALIMSITDNDDSASLIERSIKEVLNPKVLNIKEEGGQKQLIAAICHSYDGEVNSLEELQELLIETTTNELSKIREEVTAEEQA